MKYLMIIIITFLKRYWEQSQNRLFIQKPSGRPVFTVFLNYTSVVLVVSRYMLTYVVQTCVSATGCTNLRPQVKKMSHTFWILLKNLIEKSNILGVCWGVFGHFESSSVKMQIRENRQLLPLGQKENSRNRLKIFVRLLSRHPLWNGGRFFVQIKCFIMFSLLRNGLEMLFVI